MITAAGAAAALVLAVAVPQAQGMAMYNASTYYEGGTSVNFICGLFCGWHGHGMPYHEQVAYPGKGGSFELTQDGCIMSSGHPNIEDHGYAELTGADLNSDSDDVEWSMWGNAENVISGSPFNVVCAPEPPHLLRRSSSPWLHGLGRIEREFRAWDADRDGRLSRAELRAGVMRDFRQVDLNGDGRIDVRDVRIDLRGQSAAARHRAGKTALAFDLDGNGTVPPGEYWRYIRRTFVGPAGHGTGGPITLREVKAFYAALS
jgi:hypothetical protein